MTYSAAQIGAAAPAGGFQNLGWYAGKSGGSYQYFNGSFGESGAIHPDSPQQGAGQAVSSAVVSQTSPNNVSYLNKGSTGGVSPSGSNGLGLPPMPTSSDQVQPYLTAYQGIIQKAADTLNAPQKTDDQLFSEVSARLSPATALPTAPNMVDTYNSLRTDQGITDLESSLQSIKNQQDVLQTQLQSQQATEEGKPVGMNVIAGRQTEEQRQAQIQLDFLGRQQSRITDELNMRYSMINTIMQYTQQDYTNAVNNYDEELKTNMAVYDQFSKQQQFDYTQQQDAAKTVMQGSEFMMNYQQQQAAQDQKVASSNLAIYANMVQSGNLSYNDLSPDAKLNIQKLEVQSGLGIGFLENLRADNPDGKVLYAGANGVILQKPDGSLSTVKLDLGGGTKLSADQTLAQAQGDMRAQLVNRLNSYGNISPADWNTALQAWNAQGLSTDTFNKTFGQYADTNRGDFTQAYGFAKPKKTSH